MYCISYYWWQTWEPSLTSTPVSQLHIEPHTQITWWFWQWSKGYSKHLFFNVSNVSVMCSERAQPHSSKASQQHRAGTFTTLEYPTAAGCEKDHSTGETFHFYYISLGGTLPRKCIIHHYVSLLVYTVSISFPSRHSHVFSKTDTFNKYTSNPRKD